MKLVNSSAENKGLRPLFDETIIVDWYDGVTTGISRLTASKEWYLFALYYFDPVKDYRVFSLLEVSEQRASELKDKLQNIQSNIAVYFDIKGEIKSYYSENAEKIYFMKARLLEDNDYEIIKPTEKGLKYFENIDEVMNHSEESVLVIKKYFSD